MNYQNKLLPRLWYLMPVFALTFAGCTGDGQDSDAYGNFETTEVMISADASGQILSLDIEEGAHLNQGQVVGLIDTTQLTLQLNQSAANVDALRSRINGVLAQIEVLKEQKRVAEVERDRIKRLIDARAATDKQLDDVEGQISVLEKQMRSTQAQNATIRAEIGAVEAQMKQLADRLEKCTIVNPVDGVVLVKFAENHELTAVGKPLYKIADVETMYLRAYASGNQLPDLEIGQSVSILFDKNREENQQVNGTISWIASEAEFTPKLIQTKEERVDLVYAFKVRVDNPDGLIKIGMPGEVQFQSVSQ